MSGPEGTEECSAEMRFHDKLALGNLAVELMKEEMHERYFHSSGTSDRDRFRFKLKVKPKRVESDSVDRKEPGESEKGSGQ